MIAISEALADISGISTRSFKDVAFFFTFVWKGFYFFGFLSHGFSLVSVWTQPSESCGDCGASGTLVRVGGH